MQITFLLSSLSDKALRTLFNELDREDLKKFARASRVAGAEESYKNPQLIIERLIQSPEILLQSTLTLSHDSF